jgi:hypothetical protein
VRISISKICVGLVFICMFRAAGFAAEKSYLCAINEVYECVAVTGCSRISVEDANLTGIMLIDIEKKQLRTAPLGGEPRADDIENVAVTDKAILLHGTGIKFNDFFEHRRTRLYSVNSGIPGLLWYTVAVGALINMIFIWLFDLRLGTHLLLGGIISFFLATMISLIALMDNPFRGKMGVSAEAFQLVYDQLMKE